MIDQSTGPEAGFGTKIRSVDHDTRSQAKFSGSSLRQSGAARAASAVVVACRGSACLGCAGGAAAAVSGAGDRKRVSAVDEDVEIGSIPSQQREGDETSAASDLSLGGQRGFSRKRRRMGLAASPGKVLPSVLFFEFRCSEFCRSVATSLHQRSVIRCFG